MENMDTTTGAAPSQETMDFEEEFWPQTLTPVPLSTEDDVYKYWNDRLENGNLTCHHFREWWRIQVPEILCPRAKMDYLAPQAHVSEDTVQKKLILPLERFLCGTAVVFENKDDDENSIEPGQMLKQLCELGDPPSTCGKFFRMGELTYNCRDCSHDGTCVLCVDCFKNSEHKHHKYKMSTSSGGGYCDCGDPEAWSDFPHCSVHAAGLSQNLQDGSYQDPALRLPKDIQKRTEHLFSAVINYIYEMLTTESNLALPADLTYKGNDTGDLDLAGVPNSSWRPGRKTSSPGLDDYVTIIYNDEIHTFDEVIQTLPRAVECDRATAIGLATTIDREGRIVVKCGGFQSCNEVKSITERITSRRGGKPLKVIIMHSHVQAHQNFAQRLILWMQKIMTSSASFRSIFARLLLDKGNSKTSKLEDIFRHDTLLWKQARSQLHHLLVSGMLLDSFDTKRKFAEIFTRSYGQMMKDFLADDHDHSFSVTALSVQLFTVPTLAMHLISKCDVLAILFRTFMSECEKKKNDRKKLEFHRNLNSQSFRRTIYILFDLKYLLSSSPVQNEKCWIDDLRKGFLHGVSLLVETLSWMQGMDLQVRQLHTHIEFEFEWEGAFNLHMKLAPICSQVQTWCGTDRVVLIKTIRMLLKKLFEEHQESRDRLGETKTVSVADDKWSADCIDYSVHSNPVSIHAPLTRLLAGLSLYMEKYGLEMYKSHELDIVEKPTVMELIEPSLRSAVLIAQVHAGMWRRNGFSVIDQARVYHDPRCRREMIDQDITMLQLGASMLSPNDFLVNVLNKFCLIQWSSKEFDCSGDDSIRQTTTLVEEFFSLLIYVLGERYIPGVGQVTDEDALRREVIHLLCEEPMTYSALVKALSEDGNKENGLEKVIESLAIFKKPNSSSVSLGPSGKGVFELRPEFYNEYNAFFYHYTKEEQSKSDETQRVRKRASGEPECHPPPPLPPLTHQFSGLANIMQCDLFLYLIALVLERADNLKSKCFSENQVHRVLFLIGLCLREEERRSNEPSSEPFEFTKRAFNYNILPLLEQLVGSQRINSHKHLLNWTIKKWKEISDPQGSIDDCSNIEMSPAVGDNGPEDVEISEKKRLAADRRKKIMEQMKSAQRNFMKENAQLFNDSQSSLDAKLSSSQVNVTGANKMGAQTDNYVCLGPQRSAPMQTDSRHICILCLVDDEVEPNGKAFVMATYIQKSSVLSNRKEPMSTEFAEAKAEEKTSKKQGSEKSLANLKPVTSDRATSPAMPRNTPHETGTAATAIALVESAQQMALEQIRSMSAKESKDKYCQLPLLASDLHQGIHTSSCGHVMHIACWKTYFDDIVATDRQRNRNRHPPSFDVSKKEFLCPLCRTLSNSVLYIVPQIHQLQPLLLADSPTGVSRNASEEEYFKRLFLDFGLTYDGGADPIVLEFDAWVQGLQITLKYKSETLGDPDRLPGIESLSSSEPVTQVVRYNSCCIYRVLQDMKKDNLNYKGFSRIFLDFDDHPQHEFDKLMSSFFLSVLSNVIDTKNEVVDSRLLFSVWHTCAFTIHSAVWQSLDAGKKSILDMATMSSRQHQCLSAMIRYCCVTPYAAVEATSMRSHTLQLLSTLLECDPVNQSILEIDAFGALLALTFCLPSLFNGETYSFYPSGNIQDAHVLRLIFLMHIVQIIISKDQFETSMDDDCREVDMKEEDETGPIVDLVRIVRLKAGLCDSADSTERLRSDLVWAEIKNASLHFLRCAALFYHHLTCVPGPPNLVHFEKNEFDVLCKYLALPSTPSELLGFSTQWAELSKKWSSHPNVHRFLKKDPISIVGFPLKVRSLVTLPLDYSELLNSVAGFTCPNSHGDDSRVPAMCLVCGVMLCSQSYCCQITSPDGHSIGACTSHTEVCGAGNGMFLRIRECKVVLLSAKTKGCFVQPPYVDQYGETDLGLRRGNPLRLCPEKYRKLYQYWLNHSIPEEISHALESNHFFITTQWFHL